MIYKEILLRAPEPEDIDLLYRWENDATMWQLSNTFEPFSRYTLKRYIESSRVSIFESGQLRLMIDIKDSGKTIGAIDLFDFDPINLRAGIGILIADESSRRKGYAKMALEAIIDYGYNRLRLHQMYCNILDKNTASLKLFQSLGFKISGNKKEWIRSANGFNDELLLQLILPTSI